MMVSVGGLAAIINVVVLLTIAIADRAIEITVRNFAASSLINQKRAPIVHDSDTWLPNIPRSLVKYYRHPAILVTVFCTVLLLASELVTELGVDVSETCKPIRQRGKVITEGDISGRVTIVEKGASAFLLLNLTFLDGPLKRVPAGVPRRIRGNECLSCMDKDRKTYPDIVSKCSVTKSDVYEAGELEIGVDGSGDSAFGNVTIGFRETGGQRREFLADEGLRQGDITLNGEHYAAFIFLATSSKSTDEVTCLEYFDQSHIPELMEAVKDPATPQVWETTKSKVFTWKIKCEINKLSAKNFHTGLSVYRTIQLENPVNPATFNEEMMRFAPLNEEDVYRASLSIKVIDDSYKQGEFFTYTRCGVYRWKFILPMTVSLVLVLVLGLVSIIRAPDKSLVRSIPYNSRTWFGHARRADNYEEEFDPEMQTIRDHYSESMKHEMFLQEFGEVPGAVPRIGFRSKQKGRQLEKECAGSTLPTSESRYSWYTDKDASTDLGFT